MKIVYVDGFKIRNTLDDDFAELHTNLGKFSIFRSKYYIPPGEVWIDHIFKKSGEEQFLLDVDKAYDEYEKLLQNGKPPEEIKKNVEIDTTGAYVDRSLYWRVWLNNKFLLKGPIPDFNVKKEKIDDLTVVYVNGTIVRRYVDCQFLYGGHDLVYSYIPKNEIWLDTVTDPQENKYFLVHEKIERELMAKGMLYDPAHRIALAYDMEARAKDGVGYYSEYETYPWTGLSNEEIIKKHYVITDEITN